MIVQPNWNVRRRRAEAVSVISALAVRFPRYASDPAFESARSLPAHDRNGATVVLAASRHLTGAGLHPRDEPWTWVFSDPHFEHEASVAIFDRPFRSRHHGDGYLLDEWTHDVRDRDTVICLGDVTMGRPTDGLIGRLRRRPSRKILVVGNHDHAHVRRLRGAFDTVAACAHLPGGPDLLLTHVPLDDVPASCVSVHGHVHRKRSVDECRINVCVEQIGYRPIPMANVRKLARRMEQAGTPAGPARRRCWPPTCIALARSCRRGSTNANDGDALPDRPRPVVSRPSVTGFPAVEGGSGFVSPEPRRPGESQPVGGSRNCPRRSLQPERGESRRRTRPTASKFSPARGGFLAGTS